MASIIYNDHAVITIFDWIGLTLSMVGDKKKDIVYISGFTLA